MDGWMEQTEEEGLYCDLYSPAVVALFPGASRAASGEVTIASWVATETGGPFPPLIGEFIDGCLKREGHIIQD